MQSTERSGVGAEGFKPENTGPGDHSNLSAGAHSLLRSLTQWRSSTVATVALTAITAAALFVAFDVVRTIEDARRLASAIELTAIANMPLLEPRQAVLATATLEAFDGLVGVRGNADQLASLDQPVSKPAPIVGIPTLDTGENTMLGGMWLRGLGAFGLAFASIALAYRRQSAMPDEQRPRGFETLVAALPLGVACWTKTGHMVVCNEQYRANLNLDTAGPHPGETYQEAIKHLIRGGSMKLVEEDSKARILELHRQDGTCLLIDERPLASGGFITLVSDVTAAKKSDQQLFAIREEQRLLARRYHEEKLKAEAASHSKTNFLAHLSHDIRTPLNHIIGFAELMRHQTYGALGDPRYLEYVQTIKSSGEGLLASFATILDLAELEGGQTVLRTEVVRVDELLDSTVLRFRAQAARAGVQFVLGEPCEAVLHADKFALQRMIGNLIDNSLRFTPKGGKVTVAAFAASDGVVIEVSDTGIGMNSARLESLRQPFALGDARFTREGVGPGLGISISRAIAELTGGRMAIDSSPSLGTTVAISLPLRNEEPSAARAA